MTHFIRAISAIIAASDSTKISRKETEDLKTQPNSKKKQARKRNKLRQRNMSNQRTTTTLLKKQRESCTVVKTHEIQKINHYTQLISPLIATHQSFRNQIHVPDARERRSGS